MIGALAAKYARALVEVAAEAGLESEVEEQLELFSSLLAGHKDLHETLNNPAIPFSAKRRIVERLAREIPLDRIVANFLLVILENNRMRQFDEFVHALRDVLDEKRGIVRGAVETAADLDENGRRELEDVVSRLVKKRVNLSYSRDSSLIGGLKLTVGSTIFDGSIRTQLETIRARLVSE